MRFIMLLAAACLPLVFTGPTEALPKQLSCRITTYYKTADMTDVVGVRSTCSSPKSSGRTSKYYEVEVLTADTGPSGGGSGGPGNLPCEFLAAGCSNLPVAHH